MKVMTYPEFIGRYPAAVEITKAGVPNKFADQVVLDMIVPDLTKSLAEVGML